MLTISSFTGPHRFLSNSWPVRIPDEFFLYPSAEHAYQAAKCEDARQREQFTSGTAGEAKALGRKVKIRPDWEQVKDGVMLAVLHKKFAPGTQLARKLLGTGDATLIEGNRRHDNYWGRCGCDRCQTIVWQNKLGCLIMQVRKELRCASSTCGG